MIKIISLIKKKEGTTSAEFRKYYEEKHAPYMESLLPMIKSYVRNYPDTKNARFPAGETDFPYDAITEVEFVDQETYERFLKRSLEIRSRVIEDEANFCDSKSVWRVMVDVARSQIPQ